MANYTIRISGYGGEVVLGKITQEQYDYWVDKEEELETHSLWDPYESDESMETPNPITDDESPLFLGYWHENDDIEHTNGADADNLYVVVENEDGNEIWTTDDIELDHITRVEKDDLEPGYYLTAFSAEKGEFFYGEFETEKFNHKKLKFHATRIMDDVIVDTVMYGEESIDNEGGDTRGKSQGIELFEI